VAWIGTAANTLHARRVGSNAALGPDVQLSANGEQVAPYRLALTSSGVATAMWTSGSYQDLRIANLLSDGTAVAPTTVSTAPPDYCPIGPAGPGPGPWLSQCVTGIALSVDTHNRAQATWMGADSRVHARGISFRMAPEVKRVLSPPSESSGGILQAVTAPSGVGTTMWLDDSTGTRQLYMTPSSGGAVEQEQPPPPPPPPPPLPPPPPGSPDPNDCTRVKLIGAAGSGENDQGVSLGAPIGVLVNGRHSGKLASSQQFNGLRTLVDDPKYGNYGTGAFQSLALPYPALSVPWAIAIGGADPFGIYTPFNYQKSVQTGVSALLKELNRDATLNRACLRRSPETGGTRYVLAGYSQGAQVVGDVLASKRLDPFMRQRIVSVVMFGDPKWNVNDGAIEHLGSFSDETQTTVFGNALSGVLGPRDAGSLRGAPNEYNVLSYCAIRDIACQGLGHGSSGESHMHYDTVENAGQAAKLVYLKIKRLLK
jgi:hypothetical protein